MRAPRGAGWVAALALLVAACAVPPIRSAATVSEGQLPDKVPALLKYADDIYDKANATPPDGGSAAMENGLLALDKAHELDPNSYDAAWKAARACGWLADDYYGDKTKRAHFAGRGIEYAKAAIKINPNAVEGHFYSGINLGLSATTKTISAKFMVPAVRDAAKKAMQIDPTYDRGGPPRLLGALYANAPPWPASIGDPERGVEYLRQALKIAPDYPQNNFLLGNALLKAEEYEEAVAQYQIVLAAQPQPFDAHFLPKWKRMAEEGLKNARNQNPVIPPGQ